MNVASSGLSPLMSSQIDVPSKMASDMAGDVRRMKRREARRIYREQNREKIRADKRRYYAAHSECSRRYALDHRKDIAERRRAYAPKYQAANHAKIQAQRAAYYLANQEKVKERVSRYYRSHRDACRQRMRIYGIAHQEKLTQYKKRWWTSHRRESLERKHREAQQLRGVVLVGYGGRCAACGERHPEFLALDHINRDGASHRKSVPASALCRWAIKENYPPTLQLLCHNCNLDKETAFRYTLRTESKNARKVRKLRARQKQTVFAAYGDMCACCGIKRTLTLDHVCNDGAKYRREVHGGGTCVLRLAILEHFPTTLQIL